MKIVLGPRLAIRKENRRANRCHQPDAAAETRLTFTLQGVNLVSALDQRNPAQEHKELIMDFEREFEFIDDASTFVLKTKCEDRRRRKHRRGRRR